MASANESTNPWEVTVSAADEPAKLENRPPVAFEFHGELDASRIQRFYRNPYQFGCLVPLFVFGVGVGDSFFHAYRLDWSGVCGRCGFGSDLGNVFEVIGDIGGNEATSPAALVDRSIAWGSIGRTINGVAQ